MSKFNVGDKVQKVKGYSWPGEVRSVFTTTKGAVRVVVECDVPEVAGALHIYNEDQIELAAPKKKVYAVAFDVPESAKWFITQGKLYEVFNDEGKYFSIIDDTGNKLGQKWVEVPHSRHKSWTRIEI